MVKAPQPLQVSMVGLPQKKSWRAQKYPSGSGTLSRWVKISLFFFPPLPLLFFLSLGRSWTAITIGE